MIDQAFALTAVSRATIHGAMGLAVAAIGLGMILFPATFIQKSSSEDRATRTRWKQVLGLVCVVAGLVVFADRHQVRIPLVDEILASLFRD